jgi:hypothetical protein
VRRRYSSEKITRKLLRSKLIKKGEFVIMLDLNPPQGIILDNHYNPRGSVHIENEKIIIKDLFGEIRGRVG